MNGSAFDGELLRLPRQSAQATNVIYTGDTTGYSIYGALTNYAVPGDYLCWSLGKSNINSYSNLVRYPRASYSITDSATGATWTLVDQGRVESGSNGGDSGSPLYELQGPYGPALAVGMLSASSIFGFTTFSYAFKMSCCFTAHPYLLTYQP